ncbi:MAG: hypothetical protein H6652_22845 [Ardenticatenaceae bacterium]|nr:hypothetical protein [Ardenticatenaceae bacterium]
MRRALQDGINQLARAGNDKAVLGMALLNLHAALEEYFREQLANEIRLYEASEQKRATWQDLINLWESSRGLTRNDRERLFQHNSLRNDIAHGKPFSLSQPQVEEYAHFVQSFTGVRLKPDNSGQTSSDPAPPRPPQPIVTTNRGCACLTRLAISAFVMALLIGGYFVVNYLLLDGMESTTGESGLELLEEMTTTLAAPPSSIPPDTPAAEENKPPPSEPEAVATAVPPTATTTTNTNDEPSNPQTTVRVNANSNVRLGPSMEEGGIGVALSNTEYVVLETSPDGSWYKIELEPGKVGGIGSSRVTVIAP